MRSLAFDGGPTKDGFRQIEDRLSAMEDYVGEIIEDWEKARRTMNHMRAFIGMANGIGGLRKGWPEPVKARRKPTIDGHGPSDLLREIEDIVAASDPRAPRAPEIAGIGDERSG